MGIGTESLVIYLHTNNLDSQKMIYRDPYLKKWESVQKKWESVQKKWESVQKKWESVQKRPLNSLILIGVFLSII